MTKSRMSNYIYIKRIIVRWLGATSFVLVVAVLLGTFVAYDVPSLLLWLIAVPLFIAVNCMEAVGRYNYIEKEIEKKKQ